MDSTTLETIQRALEQYEKNRARCRAWKLMKRTTDPDYIEKERAAKLAYSRRKAEEKREAERQENERRAAAGLPPLEKNKGGRPRKYFPQEQPVTA